MIETKRTTINQPTTAKGMINQDKSSQKKKQTQVTCRAAGCTAEALTTARSRQPRPIASACLGTTSPVTNGRSGWNEYARAGEGRVGVVSCCLPSLFGH